VNLTAKLCLVAAAGLTIYASPRLTRGQGDPTWLKPTGGAAVVARTIPQADAGPPARASTAAAPAEATARAASPSGAAAASDLAEAHAPPPASARPRRPAVQPRAAARLGTTLSDPIEFRLADRGN
jgi:hypothetical protein